ncbi:MAG TPA: indolepyruvate ferredoxin oxidoreductase, partial [Noviherbaspirillum sp.]|nr:indolepyruvate ferredoxin oxidoreductase [Noviherbaspirillum sp.]
MGHSYTPEDVAQLRRGKGERLYGDGALVVLKALLESGISYFGGYPGSPTANLMDAVADAYEPLLKEYGVYFETSSNEMSAGALLTTSVYGPVRGAVTWKVVGNGVATDVVDHVSQLGVKDGAMIVVGEDYGVSSTTVVQRTLAWGVKSGLLVIDPRADQQVLHRMVKEGMDLSRDSKSVVALLLRPQASHTNAEITVGDNVIPAISTVNKVEAFRKDPTLFALPPYAQEQEKDRYLHRLPTAARLVVERGLNEYFGGSRAEFGLITHGTTFNSTLRVLSLLGMADEFGELDERLHLLQLNV